VYHGTIDTYVTDIGRRATCRIDGNSFKGHHELKFGFGWRKAEVTSTDAYPGNGIITYHIGYPECEAGSSVTARPRPTPSTGAATPGHLVDRSHDGQPRLRWDRQLGSLAPASVPREQGPAEPAARVTRDADQGRDRLELVMPPRRLDHRR
jgi:hypothetical protein